MHMPPNWEPKPKRGRISLARVRIALEHSFLRIKQKMLFLSVMAMFYSFYVKNKGQKPVSDTFCSLSWLYCDAIRTNSPKIWDFLKL